MFITERIGLTGEVNFTESEVEITYANGSRMKMSETEFWMRAYQGEITAFKLVYTQDIAPHFDEIMIKMLCQLIDEHHSLEMKLTLLDFIENAKQTHSYNLDFYCKVWGRVYLDIKKSQGFLA